jgi:hypothetical protein
MGRKKEKYTGKEMNGSKIICQILFLLFLTQINAFAFWGMPSDLDGACEKLACRLSHAKVLAHKRVAILRFHGTDGFDSLMSSVLPRKLLTALAKEKKRKFELVERLEIVRLMDEMEVFGCGNGTEGNIGDMFDIDRWAQKLRADYVLLGYYTWFKKKKLLDIDCQVVAPQNGEVVASATIKLKINKDLERILTSPAAHRGAASTLESLSSSSSTQGRVCLFVLQKHKKVALKGDAPVVRVGDNIGFSVCPPIDSKLYIFNYDPASGDVIFLYPLAELRPMTFIKDRVYFFPECVDKRAVSYPVYPPTGRMCFKVIGVSPGVHIDFTKGLKAIDGYYVLEQKDMKVFLDKLSLIPPNGWWEESIDFWIVQ